MTPHDIASPENAAARHVDLHPVRFSVVRRDATPEHPEPRLTKKITLTPDGIYKEAAASMTDGVLRTVDALDAEAASALGSTIAALRCDEALVLGVPRETWAAEAATKRDGVEIVVAGREKPGRSISRTKDHISYLPGEPAWILADYDLKWLTASAILEKIAADFDGDWATAAASVLQGPSLTTVASVRRPSVSGRIRDAATGARLTSDGGEHLYILTADAADAERAVKTWHVRLCLAGLGLGVVSAAGTLLHRSLIDVSTADGARLAFEAAPILGPGLTLDTAEAAPVAHDGLALDTMAALPPLTDSELGAFQRFLASERKRLADQLLGARTRWERKVVATLVARGVDEEVAARSARAAATGKLDGAALLIFDKLGTVSVADVMADLDRFNGATLADPHEPEEGRNRAIFYKSGRNGGPPRVVSQLHGGIAYSITAKAPPPQQQPPPPNAGQQPKSGRVPEILVSAGRRHHAADAGIAALAAAGVPFFQRDKALVRIARIKARGAGGIDVTTPAVLLVGEVMLGRVLGQSARWVKMRGDKTVVTDPPASVVEQVAAMVGEWPFPPLHGVIDTPTLRPDGSLLHQPGYDTATGYFLFSPPPMPAIRERPTREDAAAALALLNNDLLAEFPFAGDASRSVAMSMLLTPILRAAMDVAPAHVVTAPEAGTGKSYLQDIASVIATGDRCAVMSASEKSEETEKRLIGAALAQSPILALDNVNGLLMGDFLCQATERPLLKIRPLGTSIMVTIANTFSTFINGNNIQIGADQVRRCILCSMDANSETPEERAFSRDPVAMVRANRGKYVAACLTIARAYIVAGRPGRLPPRASYTGWSDFVRSPLVWLGWADPVDTVATIRGDDPIRQQRGAVYAAWAADLAVGVSYQTGEMIDRAEAWSGNLRACPDLFEALFAVAPARGGTQQIDPLRLAVWLRRNLGTVADGHKLEADRSDKKRPRWRLAPA